MENQLQFENLIDGLGPGCKNPMMYPAIRYYYCLGCDPQQPEYTNESAQQIRVCKSFVDRIWRDGGKEYDECGVMKSNDVRRPRTDQFLLGAFKQPCHIQSVTSSSTAVAVAGTVVFAAAAAVTVTVGSIILRNRNRLHSQQLLQQRLA